MNKEKKVNICNCNIDCDYKTTQKTRQQIEFDSQESTDDCPPSFSRPSSSLESRIPPPATTETDEYLLTIRKRDETEALEQLRFFQQYKLAARRNKGPFTALSARECLNLLSHEVDELADEIHRKTVASENNLAVDRLSVCLEAADIANYCAFIVHSILKGK